MRSSGLLRLGSVTGAALGLVAGIADGASAAAVPWRVLYAAGMMGLLGAALGALAAVVLLPWRRVRGAGVPAAVGGLVALAAFPLAAAGLGLFVNRVVLRGTHFLSPASLAADVIALLLAALLAWGAGRLVRRALSGLAGARPPSVGATALVLVPLGLAAIAPAVWPRRAPADPSLPTIVLVSIDTLRPDRLSGGGDPRGTSPEIDRVMREGLLFPEAVTTSPGSAASHASLLTSRYPVSNGVFANFSVMDTSVTTIAEILRADGYRTGGFVTNTFLGKRFHFDQGFDAYVESGVVERLGETSPSVLWRSLALVQVVDRLRIRLTPGYDPSFETALEWIRESRRPSFFFVHLMDVHSPYAPPHPYGPRFGADPTGADPRPGRRRNRFGWRPSEEAYLAEIRFTDAKIGRLRRALADAGRLDTCILVLTTDHGENLTDHDPPFSHGTTLYESTLRVLATLRAPGIALRRGLDATVFENVDVLPTVAAILGRPPHPAWEGRSFHPAAPPPRRTTWAQLNRDFAARESSWKAILRADGTRELFRLDLDPGETRPLPLPREETERLSAELAEWMARYATPLYLEDARAIAPQELPRDVVEKLKALGYVE